MPRFGRRFVSPSAAAERWGRPAAAVRRRDGVAGSAAESSAAAVQICDGSSITTWTCRRPMQTCAIRARLPFNALRLSTPSITWSSGLCRPRQSWHVVRTMTHTHSRCACSYSLLPYLSGTPNVSGFGGFADVGWHCCMRHPSDRIGFSHFGAYRAQRLAFADPRSLSCAQCKRRL